MLKVIRCGRRKVVDHAGLPAQSRRSAGVCSFSSSVVPRSATVATKSNAGRSAMNSNPIVTILTGDALVCKCRNHRLKQ
jgi:hypothetical protein